MNPECKRCGILENTFLEIGVKCVPDKRMGTELEGVHEFDAPNIITPSPRIDWCGACQKEHGYDCPKDTHTHGENGSHTRIDTRFIPAIDTEGRLLQSDLVDFLQFICLDDGVIYKELEITREVK